MNLTAKKRMPSVFTDWFVPRTLLSPEFFDMESTLLPFQSRTNMPSVNIQETPKEYQVEMAAPGLERKDFKIEVEDHTLSISAEKEEEKKEEGTDYSRKEFSYNSFCRMFTLPEDVKEGNIDAKYENGILKVLIPKKEVTASKPVKQIQVH